MLDGDPQNDPRDIPKMVASIEQGHDIVCGWRKDRKDTFVTRRVPSMIGQDDLVGDRRRAARLRLLAQSVPRRGDQALRLCGEMHRFLPAIASQVGVSIDEIVVNHRPRKAGLSKHGASRTVRVILDLATVKFLLNYSTRPLQILPSGWPARHARHRVARYVRLFERQAIGARPLLLLGMMLLFIGVQLVTFGLLAELLTRTYYESQNKPTYVIREIARPRSSPRSTADACCRPARARPA